MEAIKDWTWDPLETDFKDGLKRLKEFVKENGHARVSRNYKDKNGFHLGNWIVNRRKEYKNNKLEKVA